VNLFEPLLPLVEDEDIAEVMAGGSIPSLAELRLHQSTVWLWNRPVYDPSDGHIRLEMRALPAGPTALDMTANAALLIGLARGLTPVLQQILPAMPFHLARFNFYRAAQYGLESKLVWPCDSGCGLAEKPMLEIAQQLLPMAAYGLSELGIAEQHYQPYLDVIQQRIDTQSNGAVWQLAMLEKFENHMNRDEALANMLARYIQEAETGQPVSSWSTHL
jgi:gamma-glutamyl:cysteine ligase YbdK (ATP-grasp superfamily)